jgi:hypothetical protein
MLMQQKVGKTFKIQQLVFQEQAYITATGGTITTCGDYKIHTFTSDGTFCVSAGGGPLAVVDYLVVAGGGGGSSGDGGAGGGAGGFRFL